MSSEAYNFAKECHYMALLKILRSSQITLPAELRWQFDLAKGDYLEAQAVKEGILPKPVSGVARQRASHALVKLLDRVHAKQPAGRRSTRAQEERIAQEVKVFRKDKRSKRRA
jgi:bifunctional DNA-binding transcriptional regulator/antitoxin component of YhaV-PrlF toxin-antitoxin module